MERRTAILFRRTMTANQALGRQAWRVLTHVTRTHLYVHMDEMHTVAMVHWRLYDGSRLDEDVGPFELNQCGWYKRNTDWGPWLKRVSRWAAHALRKLNRLLEDLNKQCALARLLFKDNEPECMDETLYLAIEETKELLACFCNGWRVMLCNMSLNDWCDFGLSNTMLDI